MMHGHVPLLHDYLIHSARHLGGRRTIKYNKHRVTYDELEALSNAVAHHLVASGAAPGPTRSATAASRPTGGSCSVTRC